MTTLDDAIRAGDLDACRPLAPLAGIAAEDRDYCRQSACPRCRCRGRVYRPFTAYRDGYLTTYRFWAVCPACGHSEEL